MYFYLAITIFAFIAVIYAYNYGRNILSHEYNQPSSAQQEVLEDSIDEFFDYQTNQYCILNNVSLPSHNSSPILIDTLLVSTSGIYVIQLTNTQGQVKLSNDKCFEKLRDGNYEKLYISSQVDKTILDKLECYLPDIAQNSVHYVILFNQETVFSSIMPDHVFTIDTFKDQLQLNANTLNKHEIIVPLGMLVTNKNDVSTVEYKQKKSA